MERNVAVELERLRRCCARLVVELRGSEDVPTSVFVVDSC